MGTTPTLGLPYPAPSDPPDGATQIQALAEAVEAAVQAGVVTVAATSSITGSQPVTFPAAFSGLPVVVASCVSAGGIWNAAVTNLSPTGFDAVIRNVDGTPSSASINVQWIAVGATA